MKATVRAPGSCGELVQGTINACNFHITCPINRYSYVTVELVKGAKRTICHQNLPKTIEAADKTLDYFSVNDLKAIVDVESELLTGKGMASSTADITAAILATAVALDKEITPDEIANLALSIEPTDGVFRQGIVLFDHVNAKIYESLGEISGLNILMLDLGGRVDTLEFNSRTDLEELNRINEPLTKEALEMTRAGIKQHDLELIAKGATLSSQANQRILSKEYFDELLSLIDLEGVLGLNVAHSGRLIGIIYNDQQLEVNNLESKIKDEIADLGMHRLEVINGGLEIIDSSFNRGRKYRYG
jgi:L-threonine kinase